MYASSDAANGTCLVLSFLYIYAGTIQKFVAVRQGFVALITRNQKGEKH
jgi:hypothetical protein